MNVYDYFMNRSNVLPRINQHIVAPSTVHNLCGKGTDQPAASRERYHVILSFSVSADISNASPEDIAATVADSLHYVTSKQGTGGISLSSTQFTTFSCTRRIFAEGVEYLGGGRPWFRAGATSGKKCHQLHCESPSPPPQITYMYRI